ncbi:hypothetical protein BRD17_06700 [Halobacteriales archaeon SW_7_68_16]|nr:MAG: hypothetical protein BRD17_06700 [Halobacteriales archaeon SW_7_68_16]
MSGDTYSRVHRLHSTLELPLEDVYEYLDDPDLPDGVEGIDVTRRNNTLIISAVAAEGAVDKYTPTAQLKASVVENRVPVDGEEPQEDPTGRPSGPQWMQEEEEIETELVEYAAFKGDRETVLQNTALQHDMYRVLRSIAGLAEKGNLTVIATADGELEATRVVDGEERPATVEVVEGTPEGEGDSGVDWRDNEFISG